MTSVDVAGRFKALADVTRVQILHHLEDTPELTVAKLVKLLGTVKQPTMSHHVRVLTAAGFLTSRRDGIYVWYSATPAARRIMYAATR